MGFLVVFWQSLLLLPEPLIGHFHVVLALTSKRWSGSSIMDKSRRGKLSLSSGRQTVLFSARLQTTQKQNWATGSKQAERQRLEDKVKVRVEGGFTISSTSREVISEINNRGREVDCRLRLQVLFFMKNRDMTAVKDNKAQRHFSVFHFNWSRKRISRTPGS